MHVAVWPQIQSPVCTGCTPALSVTYSTTVAAVCVLWHYISVMPLVYNYISVIPLRPLVYG